MNRDKFVFGLHDTSIRTELLKTHLKADQNNKSMSDVVNEAKTLESAQRTNQLISDSSKILDEQVHWTHGQQQNHSIKHEDMKLKSEENTCYWCGSLDGPHPWRYCPANGKTCSNCGINDHFAKVCLENQRKPAYRGNQSGNRRMSNKGNRSGHRGQRCASR